METKLIRSTPSLQKPTHPQPMPNSSMPLHYAVRGPLGPGASQNKNLRCDTAYGGGYAAPGEGKGESRNL